MGRALKEAGRCREALEAHREALDLREKLVADFPKNAEYPTMLASSCSALAWLLATCEDPKSRDYGQAVEFARKAVKGAPDVGNHWRRLGVAEYRTGNWEDAREALEKAMELNSGGGSFDWFILAMLHWQQRNKEEAREWYNKAVELMKENNPEDEELRRFRNEVEGLLGISGEKEPE